MEQNVIIAVIGLIVPVLGIWFSIRTKKIEQDFSAREHKAEIKATAQQVLMDRYENFFKTENLEIKNRLSAAEESAAIAKTAAEIARQQEQNCQIRLAKLEAIIELREMLPNGYLKTAND